MFTALFYFSPFIHAEQQITNEDDNTQSQFKVCTIYPHLKDSYWLSINFGMTEQAKQRGIRLKVLEAGGYGNIEVQLKQIEQCITWKADAILIGSVNFDRLNERIEQVNKQIPVFSLVNEIATKKITGSTGVAWYQMGYQLGQYLAEYHQQHNPKKIGQLAWFPGPNNAGGSPNLTAGLEDALTNSNVKIATIQAGLNDKIIQFTLLKNTLINYPNIDYLAGSAVMAEIAVSEVAQLPENKRPKILSHYFSHGVYRGIKRKKILMANSDQMVLQGQMAISQVADFLQTGHFNAQQAPNIIYIDQNNINEFDADLSLSPSHFKPVYEVGIE